MDVEARVRKLLDSLDKTSPPAALGGFNERLRVLQKDLEEESLSIPDSLKHELIAFTLTGRTGEDAESRWGTYYGPFAVLSDDEGNEQEVPNLESITEETLDYWHARHSETTNVFARLRYADLIWDLSKIVSGSNPSVEFARSVIDCTIEVLRSEWFESFRYALLGMERALSLALSINDAPRIEMVREELIGYEDLVSDDESPGSWGRAFDLLVLNKSVRITESQEKKIISDLESRLVRLVSPEGETPISPIAVEQAAFRLADYYSRTEQPDEVRRVMLMYRDAYLDLVNSQEISNSISASWLQRVSDVLRAKGLRDDAITVLKRLEEVQGGIGEELTAHSHEMSIRKEEFDQWLEDITSGSTEEVFSRVAHHFVPRRDQIEEQVKDLAETAPLQALIKNVITDGSGRAVATVGSVEDDLEGHIVRHAAQLLGFEAPFLHTVLERLKTTGMLDVEVVLEQLFESPVFDPSRSEIFQVGLSAYIAEDHITAISVLVPQLEEIVREIVRLSGVPVLKPGRHGGQNLKNLADLLREQCVVEAIGEDSSKYLSVLLVDQRGLNIRHEVCHGLLSQVGFSAVASDRIIHTLLLLARLREKDGSQDKV